MFLGASAGSIALQPLMNGQRFSMPFQLQSASAQNVPDGLSFQPIKGAMPLSTDGIALAQQSAEYSSYAVMDEVVLPAGFTYDIIGSWGDPVGDSRFGYNNDYLSFVETAANEGYLTINFEYISPKPWIQTYEQVIGKELPFEQMQAAVAAAGEDGIDVHSLPDGDPVKDSIQQVVKEALTDLGIGVISLRRNEDGKWLRTSADVDRRITGISGLEDDRYLKATGPATAIFRKQRGLGYMDGLGDRIIGTFNNCAGGTTPWGTVLSAEENFQDFVPEPVYPDGTSFAPAEKPFFVSDEEMLGLGSALGYAGNKYGWMVEVDPANPNDYGIKHTWLGRFRHEAVAVRAVAGKPLAFYAGCDRRSGHVYKFVSRDPITDPTDKVNSRLLSSGMLYAAKFNPDGTGRWIALAPSTPVEPDMPSVHAGGMITLPQRPEGGVMKVEEDAVAQEFKQRFRTLGDLYIGVESERQGAILIDAHYAANAAGATCTARPEDTDLGSDGSLFIAFTSGSTSSSDGGPNKEVFKGPKGESPYEHGWIMRLTEDANDPAAMTFRWEMFVTGGEPAEGGLGFSNPDNLEFDASGNLWMVTDMSGDKQNVAIPSRTKEDGTAVSQSDLRGLFGNNSIWFLPTSGSNAGEAYLFGYGPMDAEMTGPYFTKDQQTLFLSAQHPGEIGGVRQDMAKETRQFAMKTTSGEEFMQTREVPIGSNWPGKQANNPPKPGVIAIRRNEGGSVSGV
jgi:secreted PhoX family phosphatase